MSRATEDMIEEIFLKNSNLIPSLGKMDAGWRTATIKYSDLAKWMRENRPEVHDKEMQRHFPGYAIRKVGPKRKQGKSREK